MANESGVTIDAECSAPGNVRRSASPASSGNDRTPSCRPAAKVATKPNPKSKALMRRAPSMAPSRIPRPRNVRPEMPDRM